MQEQMDTDGDGGWNEVVQLEHTQKVQGPLRQALCLEVGCGEEDTPTHNYVKRWAWAQQTLKGAQGIQVYDMKKFQFLKFQSRAAAEHGIMGAMVEARHEAEITVVDTNNGNFS